MLLTILTLSCFALGSSDVVEKELCYGKDLYLPFDYTPTLYPKRMYFTPSKTGGSRKLVMENGEVKDPRLKVSVTSFVLKDLTERDEGMYSVSFGSSRLYDVVKLKILECAEEVVRYYKSKYNCRVPNEGEFLEFTPIFSLDQSRVLWNRTDPQTNTGGRGHVKHKVWEISELTQTDNGFYNFRRKDNALLSRIRLTVKEHTIYYDAKVNEHLHIRYPMDFTPWNMMFTPKGTKKSIMLMKAGYLAEDSSMSEPWNLIERIQDVNEEGIDIYPVESTDSGVFEFRDQEGYLALVVTVNVDVEYAPEYFYVATIAGIILMIVCCCCCLKKCCCKKSSAKRESAPQSAAAPAVYCHDRNQNEGPSYSAAPPAPAYSNQPLNTLGTQEPTREPTTSLGPPVAVPGGQGAAPALSMGSDCLSSDSGPTFELKGVNFPSAPPLSSDSPYNDVYTSDKLNFL